MVRFKTVAVTLFLSISLSSWARPEEGEEGGPDSEGTEGAVPAEEGAPSGAEAATQEPAGPKFSKESAAADFEKGKALFAEGKYKEAESLFKKSRSDAATKDDKQLVEDWLKGVAGGQILLKLKAMESQGKLKTYDMVMEQFQRMYKGTPARGAYLQYLGELEGTLFQSLENFDVESATFSQKYGKYFIKDLKLSLDGSLCLRWTNTADRKAAAMKISGVPRNWGAFKELEFWVNVNMAPRGVEAVIMCGAQAAAAKTKKKAGAMPDFFQLPLKLESPRGQWKRIRVKIADFKPSGAPSISDVSYFQFQIPGGAQFDFYIDRIVLIRDEKAAPPRPATKRR